MGADDWINRNDALDIGRERQPELSNWAVRRRLLVAAGPAPETITLPDGTQQIVQTFDRRPDGSPWPVRKRVAAIGGGLSGWVYFKPDVERLFAIPAEVASITVVQTLKKDRGRKLGKKSPKRAVHARIVALLQAGECRLDEPHVAIARKILAEASIPGIKQYSEDTLAAWVGPAVDDFRAGNILPLRPR
jgi:hypothetical protein